VGILGRPMCEHVRDFKVSSAIEMHRYRCFPNQLTRHA
jgi:hypothetical protein